jgi:hypothetical protein
MSDEPSVIKKTETLIDDIIDLWQRRRYVCVLVIIVVILPSIVAVVGIPSLKSALDKAEHDRDKAQLQLAPFLAAANQHFQDIPESGRLDRLSQKVDSMLEKVQDGDRNILLKLTSIESAVGSLSNRPTPAGDRVLAPAVAASLTTSLKPFSDYKVDIVCKMGDGEAHSLADQVRTVFVNAGWEVKGVDQAIFNKPIRRIVLEVNKQPPEPLQRALLPLFDNWGYAREAALNPSLPEKGIKIIVGTK